MLILAGMLFLMEYPTQAQISNTQNKKNMTKTEQNKTVVRTVYDQALNKRNFTLLKDLISPDYTGIRGTKGAAGFEEPAAGVIKAMPDAQWHIETLIAEGDKVFVAWKVKGTQTGPFQGLAPTGNAVVNDGMGVFELREGKIVASQVLTDRLNFLQQLEVLPADVTMLYQKTAVPK